MTPNPSTAISLEQQIQGVPASPSGCQPTASAADASSQSGIPNAMLRPMSVNGYWLTPQQIAAGLSAMKGKFRVEVVYKALVKAGVVQSGPTRRRWSASTPYAAAVRVTRRAGEAGLIRRVHYQAWEVAKPRELAAIARAVADESAVGKADAPEGATQ